VARHLTEFSATLGASPVERIPVLGRTGPDITTNELGLVVDVKSRREVPTGYFHPNACLFGVLVGVPINRIMLLANDCPREVSDFTSVLVERWYAHMDEWRKAHFPRGISALVLHRPKKPIGKSMLIIHQSSVEELKCQIQTLQSTNHLKTPV
jgi:hypothetical protein